ncbi:MAG: hemolysin III family protein [bacterium]|nr:hemolysin III family protein [bacterium]
MKLREPLNGLTHFIGILIAIVCTILLPTREAGPLTTRHVVSFAVFGGGMILLFTFSTLYHWLPLEGKKLELLRKIDHIMIFVFISASYTPICLITLRGPWGWWLLGSVWGITVFGFFLKIFRLNAPRVLYTAIYLLMGWLIVIAIYPLLDRMPLPGLLWMALGGVFYSVGATIYALKKPNPKGFGFHEIFHVFIILGALSHFVLIYRYV